ncbi:imidazole glycerol phosphate synthase subunit HisH [Thermodesulfobacterium sp.]|uniref:imidazole glycerol phosphate synthase subunit HisH n=1 Tax=Thermodesulfobacterium sp. TaxID=1965289 RepID=UPI000EC1F76D|nr:imidazole glycerol phosphate synthase subunit HisH [Thermodesulfobacterium sp.]MBZ4680957.1 imidazole glycerol phosphate synthase [Thermodesulfobacterium sp.]HCP09156.1 imidazole glycerol phosphate synthase subunit HisH [Thermodesulfobacterium commune]
MIGIVDYKAGNLTSVARALSFFGYRWIISDDPEELKKAERIIFPGVGAAKSAMDSLKETGLDEFLKETFLKGTPILGICLGTQVIFEESEEDGGTKTLGLLKGKVKRFPEPLLFKGERLKVPHMGWNQVVWQKPHPVFQGLDPEYEYYFVHSYYVVPEEEEVIYGVTFHGISFPSVVAYKNLVALQFHPEKSGKPGLQILDQFCRWNP